MYSEIFPRLKLSINDRNFVQPQNLRDLVEIRETLLHRRTFLLLAEKSRSAACSLIQLFCLLSMPHVDSDVINFNDETSMLILVALESGVFKQR